MATYNTAFGALPSPKTLTGTSSTATAVGDEDEERKRNFTQQYQQQQQSQQQQQPTQTFADMQKAGQARPAPPPTQPAQTTPLVQQTAQTLGVAAPAPAMAQPSMLQTLQSQFQQPAPAAAPAPAPAQDVSGGVLTSTAPQQTGGGTPATAAPQPNAPDGTTYKGANGVTWTKRGGVWVVEASEGTAMPTGYDVLQPVEMLQRDPVTGVYRYSGGASYDERTLDDFLQRNGLPSNDSEKASLAAAAGMTPEQLDTFISSSRNKQFYLTQQQRVDRAEEAEWVKQNAGKLPYGRIPDGYTYVPASQGGPSVRRLTFAEMQSRGYDPYGGEALYNSADNQYALFSSLGTDTRDFLTRFGGAAAKPEGYDERMAQRLSGPVGPDPFANRTPPNTGVIFGQGGQGGNILTQLQQQLGTGTGGGFTPSGAGAPAQFELSPQTRALQERLNAVLGEMQGAPSVFDTEAYKARLAANEAELQAQYKTERERLDEELAARGLAASTFGGDRMQNLAGSQARALASMRADLLKEASQAQDRRQEMMLRTMADLSGQMGTQEIAAYNANLERYRTSGQLEMDARRLQQDYALKGMDLTLQQARDAVDKDFKEKSLGFQLRELLSRETLTREELQLRERMGSAQSRNNILSSLLGNIDLSGLTPEQLQSLLSGLGLNITLPSGGGGTVGGGGGTTGGGSTGGGSTGGGSTTGGGDGTPLSVLTIPTDLSPYPEGQQFLYNGQRLVKRNGILVDALTGRPFDTRE